MTTKRPYLESGTRIMALWQRMLMTLHSQTAFVFLGLVLMLMQFEPLAAASPMQPAATVNSRVVTVYDVQQRIELVLLQSNTPRNALNRRLIAPQVLDRLIDEHLQLIEAEKYGLIPSERDINKAITDFESQNNWPVNTVQRQLGELGIDFESFRQSFRANLAWQNIGAEVLSPAISIAEAEVEREIQRLKTVFDKSNVQEYRLLLIALSGDPGSPRLSDSVQRMLKSLQTGANFGAMARQFSNHGSAQFGGDLGWLSSAELQPDILQWLNRAENNALSPVFELDDGVGIFKFLDQRQASQGTIDPQVITNRLGNKKLQGKVRALERDMQQQAIIKRFITP